MQHDPKRCEHGQELVEVYRIPQRDRGGRLATWHSPSADAEPARRAETATLWPGFVGLTILGHPFIVLVYGEKWASAAVPLVFLAISSVITVSLTMSWVVSRVMV